MAIVQRNHNRSSPITSKDTSTSVVPIQVTASGTPFVPSTTVLFSRKRLDGLIETVKAKRRSAK